MAAAQRVAVTAAHPTRRARASIRHAATGRASVAAHQGAVLGPTAELVLQGFCGRSARTAPGATAAVCGALRRAVVVASVHSFLCPLFSAPVSERGAYLRELETMVGDNLAAGSRRARVITHTQNRRVGAKDRAT